MDDPMEKQEIAVDVSEALRYLGAGRNPPPNLREQVTACALSLSKAVRPRWTWKVFSLEPGQRADGGEQADREQSVFSDGLPTVRLYAPGQDNPVLELPGRTAETMLSDCGQAVLLACTLGTPFDALLRSAQTRDMAEAVILDACGSAWVEAGCNGAEREIARRFPGLYLTDRFSPGYGDLPLSCQRNLCSLLDTPRRLGVHVTDSLLMNPAKSVTAVLGISPRPQMARVRGCGHCVLRETCGLRKGGGSCGI